MRLVGRDAVITRMFRHGMPGNWLARMPRAAAIVLVGTGMVAGLFARVLKIASWFQKSLRADHIGRAYFGSRKAGSGLALARGVHSSE